MARYLWAGSSLLLAFALPACGIIDRGDNFVAPDLQLDEDFFFCRIQPEVITMHSCAGGAAGEGGMCHTARSALRLVDTMDPPPDCDGDVAVGPVSADYRANLEAVRLSIQSDPNDSPFYRRPVGLDSHPRVIFPEGDPAALLIVDWIAQGGL